MRKISIDAESEIITRVKRAIGDLVELPENKNEWYVESFGSGHPNINYYIRVNADCYYMDRDKAVARLYDEFKIKPVIKESRNMLRISLSYPGKGDVSQIKLFENKDIEIDVRGNALDKIVDVADIVAEIRNMLPELRNLIDEEKKVKKERNDANKDADACAREILNSAGVEKYVDLPPDKKVEVAKCRQFSNELFKKEDEINNAINEIDVNIANMLVDVPGSGVTKFYKTFLRMFGYGLTSIDWGELNKYLNTLHLKGEAKELKSALYSIKRTFVIDIKVESYIWEDDNLWKVIRKIGKRMDIEVENVVGNYKKVIFPGIRKDKMHEYIVVPPALAEQLLDLSRRYTDIVGEKKSVRGYNTVNQAQLEKTGNKKRAYLTGIVVEAGEGYGVKQTWFCEYDGLIHHDVSIITAIDGILEVGAEVRYSSGGVWHGVSFLVGTEQYPNKEYSWTEKPKGRRKKRKATEMTEDHTQRYLGRKNNMDIIIGMKKESLWKDRLQNVYDSFEEFESYDEAYDLAERLGYNDAQSAWDDNPMIQGSVRPEDFKVVKDKKKAQLVRRWWNQLSKPSKVKIIEDLGLGQRWYYEDKKWDDLPEGDQRELARYLRSFPDEEVIKSNKKNAVRGSKIPKFKSFDKVEYKGDIYTIQGKVPYGNNKDKFQYSLFPKPEGITWVDEDELTLVKEGNKKKAQIDPEASFDITIDYFGDVDDIYSLPFHAGELHDIIEEEYGTLIMGEASGFELPSVLVDIMRNEYVGDTIVIENRETGDVYEGWEDARRLISESVAAGKKNKKAQNFERETFSGFGVGDRVKVLNGIRKGETGTIDGFGADIGGSNGYDIWVEFADGKQERYKAKQLKRAFGRKAQEETGGTEVTFIFNGLNMGETVKLNDAVSEIKNAMFDKIDDNEIVVRVPADGLENFKERLVIMGIPESSYTIEDKSVEVGIEQEPDIEIDMEETPEIIEGEESEIEVGVEEELSEPTASRKMTARSNEEVIMMYLRGKFPEDKMPVWGTTHLKITKMRNGWALVNYNTPLLYHAGSPLSAEWLNEPFYFNTEKYSVTTSVIQNKIRNIAERVNARLAETSEDEMLKLSASNKKALEPMQVRECPKCKGRGERNIPGIGWGECPDCKGRGKIKYMMYEDDELSVEEHGEMLYEQTTKEIVWPSGKKSKKAQDVGRLVDTIRAGDKVTIIDRNGKEQTGRATMYNSKIDGWVLNMGGRYGTPAIATDENVIKVKPVKHEISPAMQRVMRDKRALDPESSEQGRLWVRYGDADEYNMVEDEWEIGYEIARHISNSYDSDFLKEIITEGPKAVRDIVKFREGGIIVKDIFEGENYISAYLGDDNAGWLDNLTPGEKENIIDAVIEELGMLEKYMASGKKISKIVKKKDGYYVQSEKGKNLGGPYKTKEKAEERLRQVEYFKHKGKRTGAVTDADGKNLKEGDKVEIALAPYGYYDNEGNRIKPDNLGRGYVTGFDDENIVVDVMGGEEGVFSSDEIRRINAKIDIDDIEFGDLVDFGEYGQLYVIAEEGDTFWVTDNKNDRYNPEAPGWYVKKNLAEKKLGRIKTAEDKVPDKPEKEDKPETEEELEEFIVKGEPVRVEGDPGNAYYGVVGLVEKVNSDGWVGVNLRNDTYIERFMEDLAPASKEEYFAQDIDWKGGKGIITKDEEDLKGILSE